MIASSTIGALANPRSKRSPCAPVSPVDPAAPADPAVPAVPAVPVAPCVPVSPVEPCAPADPAVLFLDEQFQIYHAIGIAMIAAGIVLASFKPARRPQAVPAPTTT